MIREIAELVGRMNLPDLVELIHDIADEVMLRAMQEAGRKECDSMKEKEKKPDVSLVTREIQTGDKVVYITEEVREVKK